MEQFFLENLTLFSSVIVETRISKFVFVPFGELSFNGSVLFTLCVFREASLLSWLEMLWSVFGLEKPTPFLVEYLKLG